MAIAANAVDRREKGLRHKLCSKGIYAQAMVRSDDHLRKRGYQHDPTGWRLAPAYELNPMPVDVKPRHHALTLNETDDASSMDTASSNRPGVYGVKNRPARRR